MRIYRWARGIGGRFRRFTHRARSPFTYVALGDSTVEGIGASHPRRAYAGLIHAGIRTIFAETTYHNLGKSGARVRDVVADQLESAVRAQPSLVTISVGANDILHRTRLAAFEHDLTTLVSRLRQETQATIVITNVPNFSSLPAVPRPLRSIANFRIRQYNARILRIAHAYQAVHIDAYRQSTVLTKLFPEAVYSDGFHPSDFGYALWATTIMNAVQERLGQAAMGRTVPLAQ